MATEVRPASVPAQHALRAGGRLSLGTPNALQVELSSMLAPFVALDVGVSLEKYRDEVGVGGEALARLYASRARFASLAVGPAVRDLGDLGAVWFAISELALEHRVSGDVALLLAGGVEVALTRGREVPCGGFCWFERQQFEPGDLGLRLRAGVGVGF